MSKVKKRDARKARRRRKRIKGRLLWGGIGLAVIALFVSLVVFVRQGAAGEAVAVQSARHVARDLEPGPFNTDPPTSGPHYGGPMGAGFYDVASLANVPANPEGHLVHNLEHGYIIFWYNCDLLAEDECAELKVQIQGIMNQFNGIKLIAFPWDSLDVPLVMTSWGRLQRFEALESQEAMTFIESNLGRAPEGSAR